MAQSLIRPTRNFRGDEANRARRSKIESMVTLLIKVGKRCDTFSMRYEATDPCSYNKESMSHICVASYTMSVCCVASCCRATCWFHACIQNSKSWDPSHNHCKFCLSTATGSSSKLQPKSPCVYGPRHHSSFDFA